MGKMEADHDATIQQEARAAARAALGWVTDAGVAVDGGLTWPHTRSPGAPLTDDLYFGTAGILTALAEARIGGLTEFDEHARAAAKRLRQVALRASDAGAAACATELEPEMDIPDLSLYTGLAGVAAALNIWAQASGDDQSDADVRALVGAIAVRAAAERKELRWFDLLSGQAGVMLVLVTLGDSSVLPQASDLADTLIAEAQWIDGLPDWYPRRDNQVFQPNFSHGLAGIGYAFAAAGRALGRADLLDIAILAARRLIQLGAQPNGTLTAPVSIPPAGSPRLR